MLSQDVSSQRVASGPAVVQAWDPYDVWLKRVKQPRDRLPQRGAAPLPAVASLDDEPRPEPGPLVPHAT